MTLHDIPLWLFVTVLFVVAFIFSFIGYLEKHIEEITKDNRIKMYVRGALHSAIGALVAVVVYALLDEYQHEINFLLKISLSVIGSVLSDSILMRARREIGEKNVK
jgi:uncharacterized membrane protein